MPADEPRRSKVFDPPEPYTVQGGGFYTNKRLYPGNGTSLQKQKDVYLSATSVGVGINQSVIAERLHVSGAVKWGGGVMQANTASSGGADYSSGYTRFWSWGPSTSARGGWQFIQRKSDGSDSFTVLQIHPAGSTVIGQAASYTPGAAQPISVRGSNEAGDVTCVLANAATGNGSSVTLYFARGATDSLLIRQKAIYRSATNSGDLLFETLWNGNILTNRLAIEGTGGVRFYDVPSIPGAVASSAVLYANGGELIGKDAAGNTTTQTPHTFRLFEPADPMAWSYYSYNEFTGEEINVDLYGAVKALEALTGRQFIYRQALPLPPDGKRPTPTPEYAAKYAKFLGRTNGQSTK